VRVLVTGGCGFLGSAFVRRLVASGDEVVVLDRLTDFGSLASLEGVPHEFVQGDVADAVTATGAADGCAGIVNFAAETRLDSSGLASGGFIVTDVFGTHVLLEFARVSGIRFVQVSTAEATSPSSPPAASKAAADLQVLAYVESYGVRASITRGVKAYGPYQHPVASPAASIVRGLDADGSAVEPLSGAWLHADDHAAAVELVLREGAPGEIYSVGEGDERLRALGWEPRRTLDEGLAETVEWYRAHRDWWEPIKEGAGTAPAAEQYARRSRA
jgi:dTDP-glucose 4,6-dehydratase